ncbi:guanylate-binding protein 1 isoform X2 [Python bivittatus]|uniref:Guanylate-binding protein 1 isoform X2 n=1 Tax=Python bivittatus TaxID=176946 RepID=A0A9F5N1Y8_PYTBI|nr:guanylate-binding protein 1 isoform X2 [Python bivittatus]
MDNPMLLIKNIEGKLEVCPEALEVLSKIHQPVVVVSIVGNARTGKSYLMNKLAGKNAGSSIESKTKGIWMWCVPYQGRPDQTLILLDTEGLGDTKKGDTKNDSWIFALAVLLSSTLIYNTLGTISQHAMDNLHYVTELTKLIKAKASPIKEVADSAEFVGFFPTFIWTLRDFTLELELEGDPITADEYLDRYVLELKEGDTKEIRKYNLPRECTRMFFPTRKCFIFDRPTEANKLKNLEKMQEKELDPDFVKQADQFCHYVYEESKTKTIPGGHVLTGCSLKELVKIFVDTICNGNIPCMENAVLQLAETENTAALREANARYDELMEQRLNLPTETLEELLDIHNECEEEALQIFMDRSFKDDTCHFQIELMKTMNEKKENYCQKNELASSKRCSDILKLLVQNLRDKIKSGNYIRSGGYQLFRMDWKTIKTKYYNEPRKGIMAKEVLSKFLKDMDVMGEAILKSDKQLTELDKEMADVKRKEKAAKQELKAKENQETRQEQKEKKNEKSFCAHIRHLMKKMKGENTSTLEELNRIIDAKSKEQQYFESQQFSACASLLQTEINYFKYKTQTKTPSETSPRMKRLTEAAVVVLGVLASAAVILLPILLRML